MTDMYDEYSDYDGVYRSVKRDSWLMQPFVHCEQRRTVQILFAHYSNPAYSRGKDHLVFGTGTHDGKSRGNWEYSDRLYEWDWRKSEAAYAAAKQEGHTESSADFYQAYLAAYYGKPVHLFGIRAGVNVSNGYPYRIFGFVFLDEGE